MYFIKPQLLILIICFALAACTQDSPQPVAPVIPATTVKEATAVPPTAIATPIPPPTAVSFETADGVTLPGISYGSGETAVIFSHMGEHHQNTWAQLAQTMAEQGYLALTYDMRFWRENGTVDAALRDKAAEDLLAAIAYVRSRGAQNVVLVGASLGGLAALEVADEVGPTAVIILASPFEADFFPSLRVTAEDVQAITAPILFIASEEEDFAPGIEQMYELAAEPKEIHIYPGAAHGTDLFQTEHTADLTERILSFIQTHTAEAGD
jgi:dipeptidyl aminopeptidase/acylaminoacyl peptidase